jgi:hypothetical protein
MPNLQSSDSESLPAQAGCDVISERLARLERENRRLVGIMVVVFLGSLIAVVEGSGLLRSRNSTKEIEAEGFVVRDKTGVVRAHFGLRADGTPEVALHDSKGQYQAALQAQSDGMSFLSFYDHGEIRTALVTSSDGTSYLKFLDDNGKEVSSLYHSPDKESGLALDSGGRGMHLSVKPDAPPKLSVSEKCANASDGMQVCPDTSRLRMAP